MLTLIELSPLGMVVALAARAAVYLLLIATLWHTWRLLRILRRTLPRFRACSYCGNLLFSPTARFCGRCGRAFKVAA